jgi:hypothetical protein
MRMVPYAICANFRQPLATFVDVLPHFLRLRQSNKKSALRMVLYAICANFVGVFHHGFLCTWSTLIARVWDGISAVMNTLFCNAPGQQSVGSYVHREEQCN